MAEELTPITPDELVATASALVTELVGLSEIVKNSVLRELRQSNYTLYTVVKHTLEELRK